SGPAGRPPRTALRLPAHRRRCLTRTAAHPTRVRPSHGRWPGRRTGGPAMTAATTAPAPDRDGDDGAPRETGDPFDRDVLPTPPGATGALLRSLLSPLRGGVALTAFLLLLQQAAVQAGPLLVAYGIDRAVPAFRDGGHGPLIAVAVGYLLCAVSAGALQYGF